MRREHAKRVKKKKRKKTKWQIRKNENPATSRCCAVATCNLYRCDRCYTHTHEHTNSINITLLYGNYKMEKRYKTLKRSLKGASSEYLIWLVEIFFLFFAAHPFLFLSRMIEYYYKLCMALDYLYIIYDEWRIAMTKLWNSVQFLEHICILFRSFYGFIRSLFISLLLYY